jgi:hypothetical protein
MKQLNLSVIILIMTAAIFSCGKDETPAPPPPPPAVKDSILRGSIIKDTTLTADRVWVLNGYVYIANNATITIEAGTKIISDNTNKGALCIERGAKINAVGTASNPIVFTSGKAAGSKIPGDWGGIVILGKAKTNRSSTPIIEGGIDRPYGGTDDLDNSGNLKYVRIEYAGIAAFPNSEINGLTLGGVGSGTKIEYVQTAYANDDAYEFFGGTVSPKYLVAAYTADDDFDFDFGYTGKIQFAISLRDPAFVDAGDAGNGIESDNDNPPTTSAPFTRPVLSNLTLVGSNGAANQAANHNFANRWRRNTRFVIRNSILMGYPKAGFSLEQDGTAQGYKDGLAIFRDNLLHSIVEPYKSNSTVITADAMKIKAESEGTTTFANAADIQLEAPFNLTAPNFAPKTGSPALTGANFGGDLDAFFTTTTYRGAVGTTNWLSGWTRFFTNGQ